MIIDYLNQSPMPSVIVEEPDENDQIFVHSASALSDITFVNFPNLNFEEATLKNCTFKDCREVSVHGCRVEACTYENVSYAYSQYSKLCECTFDTCCASYDSFLTLEAEGEIVGCTFKHITVLGEDNCVIHSVYRKKESVRPLKNCRFEDCEVESGMPVLCEYLTTMEMYKTEIVDNVDCTSCSLN